MFGANFKGLNDIITSQKISVLTVIDQKSTISMRFLQLAQVRNVFLSFGDKHIINQVIKLSFIEIVSSYSLLFL